MKIKSIYWVLALSLAVFASSCKKGFKTTDSGLRYKLVEDIDTGEVAGVGGYLKFNLVMKTSDTTLTDTYKEGQPSEFIVPEPTYEGCIYEGLAMLSAGDSAIFEVRADSLFEKSFQGMTPPFLKGDDTIVLYFKVLESRDKDGFELMKKEKQAENALKMQKQLDEERKQLTDAAEKLKVADSLNTLPSGLMYAIVKKTNGKSASQGDEVGVYYNGTFISGESFDGNIGAKEPLKAVVGQGGLIQGWLEVLDKMKLGEKWMLFIPSNLAYGDRGSGKIGPNTPLVFEMELVSIKDAETLKKEFEAEQKKKQAEEKQKISSFLKKKNYKNIKKGTAEFSYIVESEGSGSPASAGDTLVYSIQLFDLDEKPIEFNIPPTLKQPFPVADHPIVSLNEILPMVKNGTIIRVIASSEAFLGSNGGYPFEPYMPVMYVVQGVDIIKKK
ncbi:MAG TPA: FKBP-type peptidyl-prolyl cis-trans isomerase [Bacteroidia bacterium]|nr:FKBP-type peptidyl-prolyl cis-trans isomerase [Bacteroidia bacterium]